MVGIVIKLGMNKSGWELVGVGESLIKPNNYFDLAF